MFLVFFIFILLTDVAQALKEYLAHSRNED